MVQDLLDLQLGLDMTPADSDMFGVPDPDSLIQLPWNKEIGWLGIRLIHGSANL
jgi:glutamine synthetase